MHLLEATPKGTVSGRRHMEYKQKWQTLSPLLPAQSLSVLSFLSSSSSSSKSSLSSLLLALPLCTSRTTASSSLRPSPKFSLFMAVIAVGLAFVVVATTVTSVIQPVACQSHMHLNTPPTLYVPDRNWRISEMEPVGSIIARIHADDPENDELIFGLEYQLDDSMPFFIDPVGGVVYLNESLFGQGGKNFFLYVTVTDGQLTAKNEVYVNILPAHNNNSNYNSKNKKKAHQALTSTPSITNVVNNLTQFLPAFNHLPAVQSIRNQYPNSRPSNILPSNINGINGVYPSSIYNFHLSQQRPQWLTNGGNTNTNDNTNNIEDVADNSVEIDQIPDVTTTMATSSASATKILVTTSRTKLTPIKHNNGLVASSSSSSSSPSSSSSSSTSNVFDILQVNSTKTAMNGYDTNHLTATDSDTNANTNTNRIMSSAENTDNKIVMNTVASDPTPTLLLQYDFKSQMLSVVLVVAIIFATIILIVAILFRKRLCAFGKTFKTKSKEAMSKKSQQSNCSNSNMTDDSHNSMVLQHWHRPMAYSNRYVPWERDQQQQQQHQQHQQQQQQQQHQLQQQQQQPGIATSQLSTSAINGSNITLNGTNPSCITTATSIANTTTTHPSYLCNKTMGSMMPHAINGGDNAKTHQWEFPRHRLKFFNKLGEGAFGQVWRCEANDIDGHEGITTVAVKTLKENASEVEKKDLLSELEVMKSLEPHVNVVRLLGCCTDKDPIFVIIEYVDRGKLQTYLRNSRAERHYGNTHGKSNILTSADLTSFMYQVAKGMDYLTSRGIIHRDLAARNILISDDHTCKVADFGFARDVVTSKIYERKSEGKLPIRWMAIESLYDNIFSTKSDIWSFGILMWEIVTLGSTPYPGISASDVMRKVRDGYRLEKPEHCRRELYNIMYYCWSEDANERPTFSEIVQMLDKLLHTEMDYIELERFPDHNYYNIVHLSGEKV